MIVKSAFYVTINTIECVFSSFFDIKKTNRNEKNDVALWPSCKNFFKGVWFGAFLSSHVSSEKIWLVQICSSDVALSNEKKTGPLQCS